MDKPRDQPVTTSSMAPAQRAAADIDRYRQKVVGTTAEENIDRYRAEVLVRSTAQVIGKGAPIKDMDGIVQRAMGSLSSRDIKEGRLSTNALGEIITAVEHAKGNTNFNLHGATPRAIEQYLTDQKLSTLARIHSQRGMGRDRDAPESSSRYDGMQTGSLNETQRQAADLARKVGLGWATNNPDLLRLGPSAIQALADVQLREDSFKRFKNIGLDEKTIVNGARYFKRNGVDSNEASRAAEDTHSVLTPQEKIEHRKATEQLYNAKREHQDDAKKQYNETMDKIKAAHPEAKDKIEREQQLLKTKKEAVATTENKADKKDVAAKMDVAAKQATKSKLLAGLD